MLYKAIYTQVYTNEAQEKVLCVYKIMYFQYIERINDYSPHNYFKIVRQLLIISLGQLL